LGISVRLGAGAGGRAGEPSRSASFVAGRGVEAARAFSRSRAAWRAARAASRGTKADAALRGPSCSSYLQMSAMVNRNPRGSMCLLVVDFLPDELLKHIFKRDDTKRSALKTFKELQAD
jgi:hypothetical protein